MKITYTGEVVRCGDARPVSAAPPPQLRPRLRPAADTDIRASIITNRRAAQCSFTEEDYQPAAGGSAIARTFDELALLLPGVAAAAQTLGSVARPGVVQRRGSPDNCRQRLRLSGNNFTVDGSDNNDED